MNMIPGPWELLILVPLIGVILIIWLLARKRTKPGKQLLTTDGQLVSDVSAWQRLVNWVVDMTLLSVIIFVVVPGQQHGFSENEQFLFSYLIVFTYYFLFEAIAQKTPGKFVTRTKVVSSRIMHYWEDTRPSTGTIAARTLIRFVPFEPLSGWWHDRWSETRVVKTNFSNYELVHTKTKQKGNLNVYLVCYTTTPFVQHFNTESHHIGNRTMRSISCYHTS